MDVLFALKKLVGALLMPTALILSAFVLALFLYKKGYKASSKLLAAFGLCSLYFLSISPVADMLVRPLEARYPAYKGQAVDYVLVLGGSHTNSPDRPVSSLLSSISMNRLAEGLMIYRANPGSKLLLSGYRGTEPVSHAKTAAQVAIALGVPEADIFLAEDVKDTAEEAAYWVEFVSGKQFALVTTATHMPRSVFLFEKVMDTLALEKQTLIPAPTNFTACVSDCLNWRSWFPKAWNLTKTEAAWHEYLGYQWARLQ